MDAIKTLISSGGYEVDVTAVAEAMVTRLDLAPPSLRDPEPAPHRSAPEPPPAGGSGDVLEPG